MYYARDSHWNEKGAVLVYHTLLEACGKAHETYAGVEPAQGTDYFGDLGVMLFPVGGRPENRMQYPVDDAWHYVEGEQVEDQFIRTENEEGGRKSPDVSGFFWKFPASLHGQYLFPDGFF